MTEQKILLSFEKYKPKNNLEIIANVSKNL
jgi:hypothetical protein